VTEDAVVREILGSELLAFESGARASDRPACLTVRGLGGAGLEPIDLSVGAGEIVGCTGLLGSGFERLPYLVFGAVPAATGEVEVTGTTLTAAALAPATAIAAGIALLPADRARDSGVLGASAAENVTLATLPHYFARGRLRLARERSRAAAVMSEFNVVPRAPEQAFAEFSGGNQQKLVFAKWCELRPRVFLMHEPAQGVDIGARQEIFRRMRDASDEGAAFLVSSAEYADLARICDRVLVFRHGRVVSELSGSELTEERIIQECFRTDHGLERTAP
jgi:ribose transport system ATP-binding protein